MANVPGVATLTRATRYAALLLTTLALRRFYAKLGRNEINPEKVRANDCKRRSAHNKSKKDDVGKQQFENGKV